MFTFNQKVAPLSMDWITTNLVWKAESIQLRKKWPEAQKRANSQQEYGRIRGLLSQSILPPGTKRLEEREAELKGLGIAGPSIIVW